MTYLVFIDPHRNGESGGREQRNERCKRSIHESDNSHQDVIAVVHREVKVGRLGPLRDALVSAAAAAGS